MSKVRVSLLLCLLLAAAACAGLREHDSAGADSAYRAFGGRAGIEAIVEELIVRVVEDPRIGHHFADSDLLRLHEKLSEQICVELGGPCVYSGFDMVPVHAGRDISAADFNILVEHLINVMEVHDVPRTAQNHLLAQLAPMRDEIIYR